MQRSAYPLPVTTGRGFLVAVLCLVSMGGCAPGFASQAAPPEPPREPPPADSPFAPPDGAAGAVRYLALGDSLTQGVGAPDMETGAFPAQLAQRWRDQGCPVELRNVGVSGYTAAQVVTEQLPAVAEFAPTLVTFQAGGNDIANGVTLEDYRAGVKQVLDAVKASGARVVVLTLNEWYRSPEGLNYGSDLAERSAAFDAALIEEITAHDAQYADLRALYRQQADDAQWVEDGLHPTPAAYAAWADELARIVPAPCR